MIRVEKTEGGLDKHYYADGLCANYCPFCFNTGYQRCKGDECNLWIREKNATEGVCGIRLLILKLTDIELEPQGEQ